MKACVGVSLNPSLYLIRVSGEVVFVGCGADIILNGLSLDLFGEATCPTCQAKVFLQLRGGRVEDLEPDTAVLYVVETQTAPGTVCVACESSHLFDKEACLRRWLSSYRGLPGSIYTPTAYTDHARAIKSKVGLGEAGTGVSARIDSN